MGVVGGGRRSRRFRRSNVHQQKQVNYLKNLLGVAAGLLVIFAIVDFLNVTGWLLYPVTTIRGKISGKTDPLIAANNSAAQV